MGMLLKRHRKGETDGQGTSEEVDTEGHEVETQQEDEGQEEKELTVPELKEEAKRAGIKGYSSMKRDELIEALRG